MQNQVNMNQVSVNVEGGGAGGGAGGGGGAQPQFIIQGIPALQGGVVNLAELLNKASTGTHTHTLIDTLTFQTLVIVAMIVRQLPIPDLDPELGHSHHVELHHHCLHPLEDPEKPPTHTVSPRSPQETLRRPWQPAPWTQTCSTLPPPLWSRTEVKGSSPL